MVAELARQFDQTNMVYLRGDMNREDWAKTLREINDRFMVLGLTMVTKPWESVTTMSGTPFA